MKYLMQKKKNYKNINYIYYDNDDNKNLFIKFNIFCNIFIVEKKFYLNFFIINK